MIFAALAFTACKKERTCTCKESQVSYTDNGVSMPIGSGTTTTARKYDKVSKKGAGCVNGEHTTTDTYTSGGTAHTTVSVTKSECTLD